MASSAKAAPPPVHASGFRRSREWWLRWVSIGAWPLGLPLTEPIARTLGRPVQVRLRGLTLFARLKRGSNYRAKHLERRSDGWRPRPRPLRHQFTPQDFGAHENGGYAGFRASSRAPSTCTDAPPSIKNEGEGAQARHVQTRHVTFNLSHPFIRTDGHTTPKPTPVRVSFLNSHPEGGPLLSKSFPFSTCVNTMHLSC